MCVLLKMFKYDISCSLIMFDALLKKISYEELEQISNLKKGILFILGSAILSGILTFIQAHHLNPFLLNNLNSLGILSLTTIVTGFLIVLIFFSIIFILNKVFGGTASFSKTIGGFSQINFESSLVITILLAITSALYLVFPQATSIDWLITFLIGVLALVRLIDYNKIINNFSSLKSVIIVFILPMVIALIISFIFVALTMNVYY